MTEKPASPIRPTDNEARSLARALLREARLAALGTIDRETGGPMVTRIAFGADGDGSPLTLISDLSHHSAALKANPAASILVGEPGERGDPLNQPRLTIQARADFISRDEPEFADLRSLWLARHPKSKLYVDFLDFRFVRFAVARAYLNGGFGKAFVLTPEDLATRP